MSLLQQLKEDSAHYSWTGPVAFVIALALLVASPVIFYMLLDSVERDRKAIVEQLESRIVQCENNAMLRRMLGITDTHPICKLPHDEPHK